MVWMLLICFVVGLLIQGWKLKNEDERTSPVSMQLPDQTEHRAAKVRRASAVSTQLQRIGLMPQTESDGYTFALPHARLPFSLSVSSTTTNSTLEVSGRLPTDAALAHLTIVTGYHTEMRVDGPAKSRALFEQSGARAKLFAETAAHKTTQCLLDSSHTLTMTLELAQGAALEETCTWLMGVQDELSRREDAWLAEIIARTRRDSHPELARPAMAYLIAWHADHVAKLSGHASELNDWAHIALLQHVHGTGHAAMSDESLAYIEQLIAHAKTPDALRIQAMNLCLDTAQTISNSSEFSKQAFRILSHSRTLSDELLALVTRVSHDTIDAYYLQGELLMRLCEVMRVELATHHLDTLLGAPWEQLDTRHEEMLAHAEAERHLERDTELGTLCMGAISWPDVSLFASLTGRYFTRPLLSDTHYSMWAQLVRHRADDLAREPEFLKVLAAHIAARRQRHGQLCRLLILELGHSELMPELLALLLPSTRPHTHEGWMRCAALVCEQMIEREDMLEVLFDLLNQCPSEDTARRLAAKLPSHRLEVQDFLLGWSLTPRSVRHQLLHDHTHAQGPLELSSTRALVDLLTHKTLSPHHAASALAILEKRGPIQAVKMLHEVRTAFQMRDLRQRIDEVIEALSERFHTQGGELSLSASDTMQGALSVDQSDAP